jgi:DNA adenine methylase
MNGQLSSLPKMTTVKPVLKWVGGKTQILDEILSRFPFSIHHYHEPFLGGGSVLLGLLSRRQSGSIRVSGTIYASDVNSHLIGLYQTIQRSPEEFIIEVRRLINEFSTCLDGDVNRAPTTLEEARSSRESYYYWIRIQFNALQEQMTPRSSAMLLFLNKTCFRGLYREGPHGFNVPYGNYVHAGIMDETHIRTVSQLLQGVVFRVQSFTESLAHVQRGDFIYLDPPYAPETATSFVSYTADGFGIEQHNLLFTRCQELTTLRVPWLMSNADVPLVRDTFPAPYSTHIFSCRRSIHSKKPDSKTNEVLIANDAT